MLPAPAHFQNQNPSPCSGETDTKTPSDVMMLWPQLNQFKRCLVSGLCGNGQRPSLRPSLTGALCHLATTADFRRASSFGWFILFHDTARENSPQSRHLPCALGYPGLPPEFHSNTGIVQSSHMQITQKSLVTYQSQVSVMRGHASCFVLLEVSSSVISFKGHRCLHRGSFTDAAF